MTTLIIFCAKYLIAVPVVLLGAYALAVRGSMRREVITVALIGLPLTYVLGKIVGLLVYDPRPFVIDHIAPLIPHAADNGFPSDHMLLAAAIAQVGLHVNRRLGYILWVLALLIGASRVVAHIHHAADIVASASIAIIAVWVAERIAHRIGARH